MRLGRPLIAAGLAAGAALSSPAHAQLAPGYSGDSGVRYMDEEEMFSAIRQLGDCLAQRRTEAAAGFLATDHGSDQEGRAVRALLGNNTRCAPRNSRMALPRDIIRGSVAEAMYKRHFPAPPPPAQPAEAAPAAAASLVAFSRCVVQRNPSEVHDLVTTTRLGSREEHGAVTRLMPQLRQCLPPTSNPQLVAPLVRLSLADALYERARRGQAPQPGTR